MAKPSAASSRSTAPGHCVAFAASEERSPRPCMRPAVVTGARVRDRVKDLVRFRA